MEEVLEVEKEVTGEALSAEEVALIEEMRKNKAKEQVSSDVGNLLLGIAEEYPDYKEDITNFVQKKILKQRKAASSTRSSTGWLVTGTEGTIFCPNTEQARLFIAQFSEKGCPAGTAASLEKHAVSKGFKVEACSDPEIIEKYPKSDGLKRVYEGRKRTPFAVKAN